MSSILFVFSQAPHGRVNAQEGFDALLMGSAFADCGALFCGEGVLQLLPNQDPEDQGYKHYAMGFSALKDYGVSRIGCSLTALEYFGVSGQSLIIEAEKLDDAALQDWLSEYDKVLNF